MEVQTKGLPYPGRRRKLQGQMVEPSAPPGEIAEILGNYVADPPPAVLWAAKLHLERVEGHET